MCWNLYTRQAADLPLGGLTEACCMQSLFPDTGNNELLDSTVAPALPCSSSYALNSPGLLWQLFSLFHCQPSPGSTGSASGSAARPQSEPHLATQHKRKRGAHWCSCSGEHFCQLHTAQASFRKSLRRGFLSPLTCEPSNKSMSSIHMKLTNGSVMASAPTAGLQVKLF